MNLSLGFNPDWISQNPEVLELAYPNGVPKDPLELVQGAVNACKELLPLYEEENSSFSSAEIGWDNEIGVNCFARAGLLHCILSPFQQITPRIVHNRSLLFDVRHLYNIAITPSGLVIVADNNVSYENSRNDVDPGFGTFTVDTLDPLTDEVEVENRTDRKSQIFGRLHHEGAERTHDIFWQALNDEKTLAIDTPTTEEIEANRALYDLNRRNDSPNQAKYLFQTTIYSRRTSNKLAEFLSEPSC